MGLGYSNYIKLFEVIPKSLGTKVKLRKTFQPQTSGQVERTIQTLEDILRACVIDSKGNGYGHLPLIEFAYNNSYHSSTNMSPFEALYERRCRPTVGWFDVCEISLIGQNWFINIEKV